MTGVENADFGLFGGRLALERLALEEVVEGSGLLPERIVQGAVQARSMVNPAGLHTPNLFLKSGLPFLCRLVPAGLRNSR